MNELFYNLIRLSIGVEDTPTRMPTESEWGILYQMAQKQSLVGICFAGIQRLVHSGIEDYFGMNKLQYLTWMGMAAKIQQRDEMLRKKGEELIDGLRADNMVATVLKGQSLVPYYGNLSNLRQSGDIDVWVKNKSVIELDAYVKELGLKPHTTAVHVNYEDTDGVEIELHAIPAFFRSYGNNRKLKRWFKEFNGSSTEFNLVYMMVHMYHHVLFEGLGLRQVMDYYFVLMARNNVNDDYNLKKTISYLGMLKFAEGMAWVIGYVFFKGSNLLPLTSHHSIKPNEKIGRLLLDEIMTGGNFGHHDKKNKNLHGGTAVGRSLCGLRRNMKFFALGPWEILSFPVWSLWHYWWRKKHGLL